jgi:hypothetical protein
VSGLNSINYLQGLFPGCIISVYNHGTQTLTNPIYADSNNTPLSNPFTANAYTSPNSGGWIFWVGTGACYDVVGSGGVPLSYASPITLTEVCPVSGGSGAPEAIYQHNETEVGQQPILDFDDSATVILTLTNDVANNRVKVSAASTASGGVTNVTGVFPIKSTMGSTPAISLQNSGLVNVTAAYGTDTAYPTCSGGPFTLNDILVGDAQGGCKDSGIPLSVLSLSQGITDIAPISGDQVMIIDAPVGVT